MFDQLTQMPDMSAMTNELTAYPPDLTAAVLACIFHILLRIIKRLLGSTLTKARVPEEAGIEIPLRHHRLVFERSGGLTEPVGAIEVKPLNKCVGII